MNFGEVFAAIAIHFIHCLQYDFPMKPFSCYLSYLSTAVLLLAFLSCKAPCSQFGFDLYFNGFDSTEKSRILLKKYDKSSNFATLLETKEFAIDIDSNRPATSNEAHISADHDWEVELPLAARTYKIEDIAHHNDEQSYSPLAGVTETCSDGFDYTLNGVWHSRETVFFAEQASSLIISLEK